MQLHHLQKRIGLGYELDYEEIGIALQALLDPALDEESKVNFLLALTERGETGREMASFAMHLRDMAVPVEVDINHLGGVLLDVCGTGGDGRNTFNVSTCASFILASAGIPVAKHGNRGISSKSGSFDVLDVLGVRYEYEPDKAALCLMETGICFLFAPLYQPVFKVLAPLRKKVAERGSRTVFNLLGPSLNPARPNAQVVGVPDFTVPKKYVEVLRAQGVQRAMVVCGRTEHGEPMDELSVLGSSDVSELNGNMVEHTKVHRADFNWPPGKSSLFQIQTATESAKIILEILQGIDTSLRRDMVLLNAAAGFKVAGRSRGLRDGLEMGRNEITSGRVAEKFLQVREFTRLMMGEIDSL